jgi:hypothetical protein
VAPNSVDDQNIGLQQSPRHSILRLTPPTNSLQSPVLPSNPGTQRIDSSSAHSAGSDATSLFGSPINVDAPESDPEDDLAIGSEEPEPDLMYLPNEDLSLFTFPSGIIELPHIRLAYLAAVSAHILDRVVRASVERTLRITLTGYSTLNALPEHPKPVTTLAGVYRRLGLDPDPYIIQRPMCSKCYCIYTFDDINAARSRKCRMADCGGTFWDFTNSDRSVRHPKQVAAYTDIVAAL